MWTPASGELVSCAKIPTSNSLGRAPSEMGAGKAGRTWENLAVRMGGYGPGTIPEPHSFMCPRLDAICPLSITMRLIMARHHTDFAIVNG